MSNAAKKLEAVPPKVAPDGTKPIPCDMWFAPAYLGTSVNKVAKVGGDFTDGMGTSGRVLSIVHYPTGATIVEVITGWLPNRLPNEQQGQSHYIVITGGHGKVL